MRLFFLRWLFLLIPLTGATQNFDFPMSELPLRDLSAFRPAAANWQVAGDVQADLNVDEQLMPSPGAGVLVNRPDNDNHDNLFTRMEHGDVDIELDVLMARHSNSGVYLQGRYEVQLLDSWGKQHPAFSDIGGIYQRWDDNKPEGQKGFQGVPPRLNASRAPGIWQHLRIEFQAPRFDSGGKKIANARFIRVVLNGVTVQENVEVTGPTRASAFDTEAAVGPLMLQGDHGPVAFRNIRYRSYSEQKVTLEQLKYRYFAGEYDYLPHFPSLKPDASGDAEGLTWEYAKGDNDFALQFNGMLVVPDSGMYRFTLSSNANSMLQIGGDTVIGEAWWTRTAVVRLDAGATPVEITYCKVADWLQPGLGLTVEGPHFRPIPLHLPSSMTVSNPVAPILIQAGNEPELQRCFMDIYPDGKRKRIVHAISVGYPGDISFTLDLDNGALVQVWRGGFLDATPMWNDRGDGHANPLGSVLMLGDIPQVGPDAGVWPDTLSPADSFHLKGYYLDAGGSPAFEYTVGGAGIKDRIVPGGDGRWLTRELTFEDKSAHPAAFRLASGQTITQVAPDTWLVDDKRFYIQVLSGQQPLIRQSGDRAEMLLPMTGTLRYNLIW